MGARRHTTELPLDIDIGGLATSYVTAHVTYTVTTGHQGYYGQPAEGPAVEVTGLTLRRGARPAPCPDWLADDLISDDAFIARLLSEAAEQDECARDDAADARREEMRERA